jgi:hypothetical protein
MPHKNIVKLFKGQRCFPCSNWCSNFPEIKTQSVKNIKGKIIIRYWMIDECDLIGKGFHRMKIIRDGAISSLKQGKFFLELHGSGSRFIGIHVIKFFPSLMRGFGSGDEWGNSG